MQENYENMSGGSAYTLLIVENGLTTRRLIGGYLKEQGLDFQCASSGAEALESALNHPPDLILLDISLPDMDGFELCRLLKSESSTIDIPVIFLTGRVDTKDILLGFDTGAVDFITKPFKPAELIARIYTHLELKRSKELLLEQNSKLENYINELRLSRDLTEEYSNKVIDLMSDLMEREEQLKQANGQKDKFLSIVAHDLKNPIGAFLNLSELLVRDFDTLEIAEVKEMVGDISDASKQLFSLLENLLEWSRSQTGRIQFNPHTVDLNEITSGVLYILQLNANAKNIALVNEVPPESYVHADDNMIRTVIRNLASNAVKFTPSGGTITVYAKRFEHYFEMGIRDTGVGISQENINKLFRIDTTFRGVGTANEKGTGLGLILCKEFINKHEGDIWVESTEGKGSTFIFTIPIGEIDLGIYGD